MYEGMPSEEELKFSFKFRFKDMVECGDAKGKLQILVVNVEVNNIINC